MLAFRGGLRNFRMPRGEAVKAKLYVCACVTVGANVSVGVDLALV